MTPRPTGLDTQTDTGSERENEMEDDMENEGKNKAAVASFRSREDPQSGRPVPGPMPTEHESEVRETAERRGFCHIGTPQRTRDVHRRALRGCPRRLRNPGQGSVPTACIGRVRGTSPGLGDPRPLRQGRVP